MRVELDEIKVLIVTNFSNRLPICRNFLVTNFSPKTSYKAQAPTPITRTQTLTPIFCINFPLKTNTTSNPSLEYLAHAIRRLTSDFIARTPNW
jgi:hypothetical protein